MRQMHFVDEGFNTKRLWESVAGYITSSYDLQALETVYLHAGGGKWIKAGLEHFRKRAPRISMVQAERRSYFTKLYSLATWHSTKNWNRCQSKTPQQLDAFRPPWEESPCILSVFLLYYIGILRCQLIHGSQHRNIKTAGFRQAVVIITNTED